MFDRDIFPELNAAILQDIILKIVESCPFIEKVSLYRGMKGTNPFVLIFLIPTKTALKENEDQAYAAFNSFEAAFDSKIDLEAAFQGPKWDWIEVNSENDQLLKSYIVKGSNHWVLYQKPTSTQEPGKDKPVEKGKHEETVIEAGRRGGQKGKRNLVLEQAIMFLLKERPERQNHFCDTDLEPCSNSLFRNRTAYGNRRQCLSSWY